MSVSENESPAVDRDVLESLIDAIGVDSLREIIAVSRTAGQSLCAAMSAAVAAEKGDALRAAAHQLRGSSANLGAVRLPALCGELERLGSAADYAAAGPVLREALHEYSRVETALASVG